MTNRDSLVRYTASTRTNHWLAAISIILAGLSGLALFHPALFWLSNFFGGGPWTRILHPFIGLFGVLVFGFLAATVWDDNLMRPADWQWLRQFRDVLDNRPDRLPEVGRYNGGQKILFFVMAISLAGLLLSGPIIWEGYFSAYFSIGVVRFAALLHAFSAFVLILSILVHIYAAIWVKGSVEAMIRGTVTPGWAWRHSRGWLRQMTDAANPPARPD